jgi:hypothetical protein
MGYYRVLVLAGQVSYGMAYQSHFKGEGLRANSQGIFCFSLEDKTNRPPWNVDILTTNQCFSIAMNSKGHNYIAAET